MGAPVGAAAPERADQGAPSTYPPLPGGNATAAAPEKRSGAARSMAAMWLASQAATGETDGAVVELDPSLCEPSAIADRVPDATDEAFTAFAERIREEGQRSPILVRPKEGAPGRYEIAYGRRRTRVARTLGRPVLAIVRPLSDAELIVAQGSENLAREDLSFIERAHFANNMAQAGIAREVILKAMGTDASRLSNFLAIAQAVPGVVLTAIGPAPGVGRPRWLALVDRIRAVGHERTDAALASAKLAGKPSDERFSIVFTALAAAPAKRARPRTEALKDARGVRFARLERSTAGLRLTVENDAEPGFGDYLADRLPEILAAFRASKA